MRGSDESVQAAVTIIEDVTAAKRAALRTEYLARVSEMLASSLDYQQTLRNVAGLAVPQIAPDWCAVDPCSTRRAGASTSRSRTPIPDSCDGR